MKWLILLLVAIVYALGLVKGVPATTSPATHPSDGLLIYASETKMSLFGPERIVLQLPPNRLLSGRSLAVKTVVVKPHAGGAFPVPDDCLLIRAEQMTVDNEAFLGSNWIQPQPLRVPDSATESLLPVLVDTSEFLPGKVRICVDVVVEGKRILTSNPIDFDVLRDP